MSRGMANGPAELREHFFRTVSEDLEAEVAGLEAAVDRIERPSPVRNAGDRQRPQGASACAATTGAEADKAYAQTALTSACAAIVTAPTAIRKARWRSRSGTTRFRSCAPCAVLPTNIPVLTLGREFWLEETVMATRVPSACRILQAQLAIIQMKYVCYRMPEKELDKQV
jgi:hypothetical protein